jgi:hypothetical protein
MTYGCGCCRRAASLESPEYRSLGPSWNCGAYLPFALIPVPNVWSQSFLTALAVTMIRLATTFRRDSEMLGALVSLQI